MIQQEFKALVLRHANDEALADHLWLQLEAAYSQPERYFHNLTHLEQLIEALTPLKPQADDWDTLLFAVFYHDFVYDVLQYVTDNNNEDKSAEVAIAILASFSYPPQKTERCRQHILATKKHQWSSDGDTNLLTDADLSILGQPWEAYDNYRKNIRREYDVYPDAIYHAGRIKVLQQFLQMEALYKTEAFQRQFELQAEKNISRELEIISLS
jgi:predicted metal-dependent HD superfamily phosphohydrolase